MENKARPSRPTIGVKDNNNNILRLAPKSENANDKPHYAALNAFEFKRADTDKNTTSIDQPVFTPLASTRPRANLTESSRDAAAAASVGKSRDLAETHSLSIYYMNNKERNEAVNLMLADGEYAMRASHVDPCTDYEEYLRRADRKLGSTVGQRCRSLATQTSFSNSPSPSPSPSSSMRPTSSASSATSTLSKSVDDLLLADTLSFNYTEQETNTTLRTRKQNSYYMYVNERHHQQQQRRQEFKAPLATPQSTSSSTSSSSSASSLARQTTDFRPTPAAAANNKVSYHKLSDLIVNNNNNNNVDARSKPISLPINYQQAPPASVAPRNAQRRIRFANSTKFNSNDVDEEDEDDDEAGDINDSADAAANLDIDLSMYDEDDEVASTNWSQQQQPPQQQLQPWRQQQQQQRLADQATTTTTTTTGTTHHRPREQLAANRGQAAKWQVPGVAATNDLVSPTTSSLSSSKLYMPSAALPTPRLQPQQQQQQQRQQSPRPINVPQMPAPAPAPAAAAASSGSRERSNEKIVKFSKTIQRFELPDSSQTALNVEVNGSEPTMTTYHSFDLLTDIESNKAPASSTAKTPRGSSATNNTNNNVPPRVAPRSASSNVVSPRNYGNAGGGGGDTPSFERNEYHRKIMKIMKETAKREYGNVLARVERARIRLRQLMLELGKSANHKRHMELQRELEQLVRQLKSDRQKLHQYEALMDKRDLEKFGTGSGSGSGAARSASLGDELDRIAFVDNNTNTNNNNGDDDDETRRHFPKGHFDSLVETKPEGPVRKQQPPPPPSSKSPGGSSASQTNKKGYKSDDDDDDNNNNDDFNSRAGASDASQQHNFFVYRMERSESGYASLEDALHKLTSSTASIQAVFDKTKKKTKTTSKNKKRVRRQAQLTKSVVKCDSELVRIAIDKLTMLETEREKCTTQRSHSASDSLLLCGRSNVAEEEEEEAATIANKLCVRAHHDELSMLVVTEVGGALSENASHSRQQPQQRRRHSNPDDLFMFRSSYSSLFDGSSVRTREATAYSGGSGSASGSGGGGNGSSIVVYQPRRDVLAAQKNNNNNGSSSGSGSGSGSGANSARQASSPSSSTTTNGLSISNTFITSRNFDNNNVNNNNEDDDDESAARREAPEPSKSKANEPSARLHTDYLEEADLPLLDIGGPSSSSGGDDYRLVNENNETFVYNTRTPERRLCILPAGWLQAEHVPYIALEKVDVSQLQVHEDALDSRLFLLDSGEPKRYYLVSLEKLDETRAHLLKQRQQWGAKLAAAPATAQTPRIDDSQQVIHFKYKDADADQQNQASDAARSAHNVNDDQVVVFEGYVDEDQLYDVDLSGAIIYDEPAPDAHSSRTPETFVAHERDPRRRWVVLPRNWQVVENAPYLDEADVAGTIFDIYMEPSSSRKYIIDEKTGQRYYLVGKLDADFKRKWSSTPRGHSGARQSSQSSQPVEPIESKGRKKVSARANDRLRNKMITYASMIHDQV